MADRIEVDSSARVPAPSDAQGLNWGRRMVTLLIAIAAVGGFALVVVYSYNQGDKSVTDGNAPVITAQSGPTKVRPKSPGGMAVLNQDKQVYGQLDSAKRPEVIERLLPPPESVAQKPMADSVMAGATDSKVSAIEKEQASIAAQLSAIAPAAGNAETVPPPPALSPRQIAAVPPEPMQEKPASKRAMASAPTEKAKIKPSGKSMPSSYRIQIASLRSEAAARNAWTRLTKRNKDLLGKLEPDIVRIDLAGKGTFYRLQAGPVEGASEARSLCSNLKKRKIGCLVVRP